MDFLICGLILTHYNCGCIPVPATLKMTTLVAETRRWLLYNTLTFMHLSAFVGL